MTGLVSEFWLMGQGGWIISSWSLALLIDQSRHFQTQCLRSYYDDLGAYELSLSNSMPGVASTNLLRVHVVLVRPLSTSSSAKVA